MGEGQAREAPGHARWSLIGPAALTLLFLLLGIHFARAQNLWIDESTQLSGSRLPLATMVGWLTGHGPGLGVPPDRMPPISYLVDALVWTSGCSTDLCFRLVHLAAAAAGLIAQLLPKLANADG